MAHAVVEWTANLEGDVDLPGLLKLIAAAMRESGIFPWGGIRVRGIRLVDFVIADSAADYAFVHVTVMMGAGRDAATKKAFFDSLFQRIEAHFAELFSKRYLALSMYVEEADETASYKQNNLHARFRKGNG